MSFLLTPPVVVRDTDIGFSLFQVGHMEAPELFEIMMSKWSALRLLRHWHSEIGELLSGHRKKCCIVCGLQRFRKYGLVPTQWWKLYLVHGEIRVHNQIVMPRMIAEYDWKSPEKWWRNIPKYSRGCDPDEPVSEWTVSLSDLRKWYVEYDFLLKMIESFEDKGGVY